MNMAVSQIVNDEQDAEPAAEPVPASRFNIGRRTLVITAIALLIACGLGGAYAAGMFGKLAGTVGYGTAAPGAVDLPEIITKVNAGPHRSAFVRLRAQLLLANKTDEMTVTAAQSRIRDMFLTYLRDMRPEELRGSEGTHRLREELLGRANIALAPARVTDILFVEMLIQ